MTSIPQSDSGAGHPLETLADALDGTAYAMTFQHGRRSRLTITNRRAAVLTESVYVENGWYWWSWGEKLAPIDDVAQAVGAIAVVLHVAGDG